MEIYPKLIENGARMHLIEGLINVHNKKMVLNSIILNVVVFVIFTSIFGMVLYLSRKNKLSPYDQNLKDMKEQEYILTKIRHYQNQKKDTDFPITSLPNLYSPIHVR